MGKQPKSMLQSPNVLFLDPRKEGVHRVEVLGPRSVFPDGLQLLKEVGALGAFGLQLPSEILGLCS